MRCTRFPRPATEAGRGEFFAAGKFSSANHLMYSEEINSDRHHRTKNVLAHADAHITRDRQNSQFLGRIEQQVPVKDLSQRRCIDTHHVTVVSKKLKTFKRRVKELIGRSRGVSMTRRLTDLNRHVRAGRVVSDWLSSLIYSTNWMGGFAAGYGRAYGNSGVVPPRR